MVDDWKDDIAHDAIRFVQSGTGDLEQQILLARDASQILEQFAIHAMLGTSADMVNCFDQQIEQVVG